ncbi:hypothetical protein HBH98_243260 [Parastagonospora nodorum]|nr:hypothetical protein HBH53_247600 [Parastagonospora nodorum]KAH3956385.1 hypothetical protein HBH51_242830 [Parastagonospora nodorum]KAH4215561.1 hypothetical protein HBI06_246400 [Parastagonospora nodorum]KAH4223692.1 hypothetical protein HBI05_242310 [Parastagonospora nodorum]KAH4334338.1 hypothetical protein HBH98_243260 [Parastagonospora nodorum]
MPQPPCSSASRSTSEQPSLQPSRTMLLHILRHDLSASSASAEPAAAVAHGLQVVAEGTNPTVDIVAVHGLNGHREKTWTAGSGVNGVDSINWLRDLLPHDLPNARILSMRTLERDAS